MVNLPFEKVKPFAAPCSKILGKTDVVGGQRSCASAVVPRIQSYRDLIAWQKAMDLVILIYQLTENFPARERFGLAFELRKSAVSIPSNISEGHSQGSGAYVRHLVIAVGSHSETSTQSEIAFRLKFIVGADRIALENLLGEVGRLTQGLLNSQRRPVP